MNKVILLGYVGNINYKILNTTTMTELSLATNEKEKTSWHNVKGFGKIADLMNDFIGVGNQLLVEGKIQYNEFVDKNGSKQKRAEIIISSFKVVGKSEANFADDNIPF